MHHAEIAATLSLPPNTNQRNVVARSLRQHAAGGDELISAKEALASIANNARTAIRDPHRIAFRSENERVKEVAEIALAKLADIEDARAAARIARPLHALPRAWRMTWRDAQAIAERLYAELRAQHSLAAVRIILRALARLLAAEEKKDRDGPPPPQH
jgi:hypothetical protein